MSHAVVDGAGSVVVGTVISTVDEGAVEDGSGRTVVVVVVASMIVRPKVLTCLTVHVARVLYPETVR